MDLKSYVAFTPSTAIYTKDNEVEYLSLGLVSEVGELSGKVAKLFRGDKTIEGMKEKIAQEVGDIFWFLSQMHHLSEHIDIFEVENGYLDGVYDYEWHTKVTEKETLDILYSLCKDLQLESWHFLTYERLFETDSNSVILSIMGAAISVVVLLGYTAEEVYDLNYEKLTGRKAAGTIKGDGDDIYDRH